MIEKLKKLGKIVVVLRIFCNRYTSDGHQRVASFTTTACSYTICLPFEHVNLGASLFERDFVHRQLHEMNAASVILFQIFDSHRIRNGARIKPSALV
jgi:hypothetical protein